MERAEFETLRAEAASCRNCDLWRVGTQTVFGEGSLNARLLLIGEQPGDQEDVSGRPFVGPAGRELDQALASAGIPRESVYLTNAVKHFKWVAKGERRLHQKPNRTEVVACSPWLAAEIELIDPEVLVCLGATAAQAVFGPSFKLTERRGQILDSPLGRRAIATYHPSAILRMRDRESRHQIREILAGDLRRALSLVAK